MLLEQFHPEWNVGMEASREWNVPSGTFRAFPRTPRPPPCHCEARQRRSNPLPDERSSARQAGDCFGAVRGLGGRPGRRLTLRLGARPRAPTRARAPTSLRARPDCARHPSPHTAWRRPRQDLLRRCGRVPCHRHPDANRSAISSGRRAGRNGVAATRARRRWRRARPPRQQWPAIGIPRRPRPARSTPEPQREVGRRDSFSAASPAGGRAGR